MSDIPMADTELDKPAPAASTTVVAEDDGADFAARALRRLATVAWLAILLGLGIQGLIVAAKTFFGTAPGASQAVVDFAHGITWSFFVCAGIGLGTTLARARSAIGGMIGAVSAPVSMGLAKGSQKVMGSAMGLADKPAILSFLTVGSLRALEYGFLGWMLARLASRNESRASRFIATGATAGLVFGGGITYLTIQAAGANGGMAAAQMITTALNEMVFPIGCSFVVWIALTLGQHVKTVAAKLPATR